MDSLAITDKILDGYKKLQRSQDTWGFMYEVYSYRTKILVEKTQIGYLFYVLQSNQKILICTLKSTAQLEELFKSITCGECL